MTQTELRKILSENIKNCRKRLSLTQEKLAERTGLSAQTINDIEGCRTWVSDKSLIKISEILHTTPALLLSPSQVSSVRNINSLDIMKIKTELSVSLETQLQVIFAPYINQP